MRKYAIAFLTVFVAQSADTGAWAKGEPLAAAATPQGITVSPPRGVDMGNRRSSKAGLSSVLSDAAGMTLYTRDVDAPACVAECLKSWKPLAAAPGAKAEGDWSVVAGAAGTQQWAYRGRALYLSIKDTKPGDTTGDGAEGIWRAALYELPGRGFATPAGITVKANSRAVGDVLVDHRGMTLYVPPEGKACRGECLASWSPVVAGELAKAVGDWTVADGANGMRHWAYKGRPVHTFNGDTRAGEANGILFDAAWQTARVRQYYMPDHVRLRKSGSLITFTTTGGLTLYARDRYIYAPGSFHADEGSLSNIAIGREIGTVACAEGCDAAWTPFKAPPGTVGSGYWSILTRADGTRQWAYQGYALYTNAKDKKPGEMFGRDVFDFTDGSSARFWRVAVP